MAAQSIMESNFGTRIINKGDAIHNTQYTFTGIADAYDRMMMAVAGAARIPVTKLFGRSPAGLNATGESDMKNYYDYIDSLRDTVFRAIIERLPPLLALSAWGEIPDDLDIDFEPMETEGPVGTADVVQKKTGAIISAYQTDLIDQETARKELQAMGEEFGTFSMISDELIDAGKGVTYSSTQQMTDPMAGLFNAPENITGPDTEEEAVE
jgi:phage-related protein (TIGR01555 family)